MKFPWLIVCRTLLFVLIFMSFLSYVATGDEKDKNANKKVQIGVKKRVADCKIKSKIGDILHMHYRGYIKDKFNEFDNSYDRGMPLTFTLGSGQVIKGWEQGLKGMCEGEQRKLVVPPELGYGAAGAPPKIPPDSTLTFEVELVKIERKNPDEL